ncbi:hypothetical protein ACFFKU_16685 [Kineococcus gynurae]|uniref:Uncharacterized protein n=1 Tax=Kineococcus gynurae TaxID=452979 RepID=A0ABV5LP87_9ACTN
MAARDGSGGPRREELPRSLRRPRSRNRFVDLFLDAAFTFTGPAQVGAGEGPQRGPRTEEEARAGYGEWDRVTRGGHTYLVPRGPAGTSEDADAEDPTTGRAAPPDSAHG